MTRSFNRAARFARLVAQHCPEHQSVGPPRVSIGPRVSRGWWRISPETSVKMILICFNRAARFARLVAKRVFRIIFRYIERFQ